ncbi:MAG: hypothetical protein KDN19_07970 [Verrucomicrobiae bacterium]|nr:hypothetical protein [Verrucomicrobiae bacterium]
MDSLMDAMTNVVGILLLILIVSSLGISAAVRKIVANIEPVSEQELQIMKTTRENTLENLEKLRQLHNNMDQKKLEEEDAQLLVAELEEFEKNNKDLLDKTSDIEEWRKKVEEEEEKKKTNEEEIKVASNELANLKAILDQTPKREVKEAKLVKMPNPRLAPEEAVAYYVVCTNKKVYFVGDPYDHVFRVRDVIDQNFTKLAFDGEGMGSFTYSLQGTRQNDARTGYLSLDETVRRNSRLDKNYAAWEAIKVVEFKRSGAAPNYTYEVQPEKGMLSRIFGGQDRRDLTVQKFRIDEKKVKAFFGDGAMGPADFKYFIDRNGTSDRLKLSLGFKEEGGQTPQQIKEANSAFQQACKRASVNRGSLLYYYVSPDSFDTYLQAREVSEAYSIPAGWSTWKGERLELKSLSPRETVRFDMNSLPVEEYRKIADKSGAALVAQLNDEVKNFDAKVAEAVPKDLPEAEKPQFIAKLTAERKDWIYTNLQPWARLIFEAALASTEVTGEKEIRIDVHPPEIPHTRIFVGSRPPEKPKPEEEVKDTKIGAKPGGGNQPVGGNRLILD